MGYTSIPRNPLLTLEETLKPEFRWSDHPEAGLVDLVKVNDTTAYAAVRHPKGYVFGCVILMMNAPGDDGNLTYKTIGEDSGPNAQGCPERIMKRLTPAEELIEKHNWPADGWWIEWRRACRHANQVQADARADDSKPVIRFNNPINLTDGTPEDTFEVHSIQHENNHIELFKSVNHPDAGFALITDWKDREYVRLEDKPVAPPVGAHKKSVQDQPGS